MVIRQSINKPPSRYKHGGSGTREYSSWVSAKDRCFNTKSHAWARYGGRGITMCEEWRNSFPSFLAHMGPRPARTTLDRIDNDGDYVPGNCRWATYTEQRENSSSVHSITADGVTRTVPEWARLLGINSSVIWNRINSSGWSPQEAVTRPKSWEYTDLALGVRRCWQCKQTLPFEEFGRCASFPGGRNYRCKPCCRAWSQVYRDAKKNAASVSQ